MASCGYIKEDIPTRAPTTLDKSVDLCIMVDSYHAGYKLIRISRNGFLILCNITMINWLSKKHPTVESAMFDSECVAIKHVVENLCGI